MLKRFRQFLLVTIFAPAVLAQTKPGLDSLSDDRLMTELGMRGMTTLLDRAMDVNKLSPAERNAKRVPVLIAKLNTAKNLTPAQRQELVQQITSGISAALPTIRDPDLLLNLATTLYAEGVAPLLNRLEYWGENPTTMSQLRPFAQSVGQIYDRAHDVAMEQYNSLANKLKSADDPNVSRVDALENLANAAQYNARMNDYVIASSIDANDPGRRQIIERAQTYLKDFDTADMPVRPLVRLQLAKLAMISADFANARILYDSVAGTGGDKLDPPADIPLQYSARYFRAVTELLDKKPDAAKKLLDNLLTWQSANLPKDKATQDGAAGAASVLEYRILEAQASLATDAAQRKKASDEAVAVLQKLLQTRPEFRGVINELLITRLGDDVKLSTLDPLMLQAIVRKGEGETLKPEGQSFDSKQISRGIDAAKELLTRKERTDPAARESVAYLLPFMHQKVGNNVAAVTAFLDFIEQFKSSSRLVTALDNAQAILGNLRDPKSGKSDDPDVTAAYDRFLPVAIAPPFNRKQFAFEYAMVLRSLGKNADALKFLEQIPADDKRLGLAKFIQLLTIKSILNVTPADSPERAKMLVKIQSLADEVDKNAIAEVVSAKSEQDKRRAQSTLASTALIAADLARVDQKDANRALQLLENFEKKIEGLPNAPVLRNEAMQIRVPALMAMGKNTEATSQLVELLKSSGGEQGQAIVYSLLRKLDNDLDNAMTSGNQQAQSEIAKSRASLSGFLVDWAKNSGDEKIRKYTYNYMRYDADAKHRAADVETTPGAQKKGREDALALYRQLETPANLSLYQQTLPANSPLKLTQYDAAVWRGIAFVSFDLEDYTEASRRLGKLLQDGRLGSALQEVTENGQTQTVDNDDYWEGIYKLIRSNLKLNANVEGQKTFLKQQYVRWLDRVGGRKWKKEFAELKRELIPDFDPQRVLHPATSGTADERR
jgi:hypothetical protein